MRLRPLLSVTSVTLVLVSARVASATVLSVPSATYATPCAAIAAAQPNDEVDIAPGTYTDSCEINAKGLTVKGVGGMPKIDLSGTNHPADYKGIYVVQADDVTVENLELTGAHIDDSEGGNGAGLRITGHDVVVHGCFIHDNQNGILAAPLVDGGTITIEYSELSHNGLGDGCDQSGCTHNVYVSKNSSTVRYDKTVFQFNWSHDLASDTADKGHLLKSRSRETDVLYNRITGEGGHDSYEVDIPNGGLGIVVGNVIEKGPTADNSILLAYGEEGVDVPMTDLYVVSNTFVNDFASGTFIEVMSGTLTAHDNLLVGPGTPSTTGALSADNLVTTTPGFVDQATYDYHLTAGSPAIGEAVPPGSAGSFSLVPAFEYVQPTARVARAADLDVGAFEYGTKVDGGVASGGGGDGGATSGASSGDHSAASGKGSSGASGKSQGSSSGEGESGSRVHASGSGESVRDGGVADAGATSGSTGGCGCVIGGRQASPSSAVAGLGAVLALGFGRARRRRRAR